MFLMGDTGTYNLLKVALDGCERRHALLANNLANVSTPGYQARDMNFQDVLAHVNQDGADPLPMLATDARHLAGETSQADPFEHAVWSTGKAPELQDQMVRISQNGIQYSAIAQSIVQQLSSYRTVIREGK